MLVRTCTAGDQQLHDLKAVELGGIVHSSVAIRVLGIQHFCLVVFGQSVQPLANHILSPISGGLVNQGRREGGRREGRGEGRVGERAGEGGKGRRGKEWERQRSLGIVQCSKPLVYII